MVDAAASVDQQPTNQPAAHPTQPEIYFSHGHDDYNHLRAVLYHVLATLDRRRDGPSGPPRPVLVRWVTIRVGVMELRHQAGLSRQQLAHHTGIDYATIYRLERVDKYPHYKPDWDTVARLVQTLGMPLSAFIAHLEDETASARPPVSGRIGGLPDAEEPPSPPRPPALDSAVAAYIKETVARAVDAAVISVLAAHHGSGGPTSR